MIEAAKDGIDHINIYSAGNTHLGRALSHFNHIPFEHPTLGKFASMEGFWHYVATGCKWESLRSEYGLSARTMGRGFPKVPRDDFQSIIMEGNVCKIEQNPILLCEFVSSNLPFMHYYLNRKVHPNYVICPDGMEWLTQSFEIIRKQLKTKHKDLDNGR